MANRLSPRLVFSDSSNEKFDAVIEKCIEDSKIKTMSSDQLTSVFSCLLFDYFSAKLEVKDADYSCRMAVFTVLKSLPRNMIMEAVTLVPMAKEILVKYIISGLSVYNIAIDKDELSDAVDRILYKYSTH